MYAGDRSAGNLFLPTKKPAYFWAGLSLVLINVERFIFKSIKQGTWPLKADNYRVSTPISNRISVIYLDE